MEPGAWKLTSAASARMPLEEWSGKRREAEAQAQAGPGKPREARQAQGGQAGPGRPRLREAQAQAGLEEGGTARGNRGQPREPRG